MKRLITTAGLAALGAASIAPGLAQEAGKSVTVGGTLRGFYDDNMFTRPGGAGALAREDSFGFEVSPMAAYNKKLGSGATDLGISYQFGLRYYFDRVRPKDDMSHQVNARFVHAFSEKYNIEATESFVVAQEPAVLEPNGLGGIAFPFRTEGDNTRNQARIGFNAKMMEHWNSRLAYKNTIYDYEQDFDNGTSGSYSAILDRMEQEFSVGQYYEIMPSVQLGPEYRYQMVNFTSKDAYAPGIAADARDSGSHFISVGAEYKAAKFLVSGAVGVQITQYQNPFWSDEVSPFGDAAVAWMLESTTIRAGLNHRRMATDAVISGGGPVADAEVTSLYLSVNQKITPKIYAQVLGQYQYSEYNSGVGSQGANLFYGGLTVTYQVKDWMALEAGYSYDRVDSDLTLSSFYRNRVFIGGRVTLGFL